MITLDETHRAARIKIVEEHVRSENLHDIEAIMHTFGDTAQYDDEPWSEHHAGRGGVRGYYEDLLRVAPDLKIDVKRRHVTDENIILEVTISGTHIGNWRGLPGTGKKFEFPLSAVYTFDDADKLAGERIYYDRATVLRQVGVFHEPEDTVGRVSTILTHPVTITRAMARRVNEAVH